VTDGWRIVLYLHLLAMAFFIGGQLVFGIAVVPLLRGDEDRETLRAVGGGSATDRSARRSSSSSPAGGWRRT
jgi:hypothetical protein